MLANPTTGGKPGRHRSSSFGGRILSISPLPEDHINLKRIFGAGSSEEETSRTVSSADSLPAALAALSTDDYSVVICESNLGDGSWKDALDAIRRLASPPLLIVTSVHADEYLWAEALNLGAYDVLAKPFSPAEVTRVVDLACQRWTNRPPAGRAASEQEAARILVVDDDETTTRLLSQILRLQGFEVMAANSAVNALSLLEQTRLTVDLLISDIQMPFIDGLTLAALLQERYRASRVLLISGSVAGDSALPYPVLLKPFSPLALTERVRQLLHPTAAPRLEASHDIHAERPSPVVQETRKMSICG